MWNYSNKKMLTSYKAFYFFDSKSVHTPLKREINKLLTCFYHESMNVGFKSLFNVPYFLE